MQPYLDFLRRGYKIWIGTLWNAEIDFTIKNRNGEIEYYQVSWTISNPETERREFTPLEMVNDNYPKFLLLTESFPQSRAGIIHKNVFEWLLEKSLTKPKIEVFIKDRRKFHKTHIMIKAIVFHVFITDRRRSHYST